MGVKIDTLRCTGCEACVYVCPVGVLIVEDDMKCHVGEGCISCGACVDACPFQAITLVDEQDKSGESGKNKAPLLSRPRPPHRRIRRFRGRGHRGGGY